MRNALLRAPGGPLSMPGGGRHVRQAAHAHPEKWIDFGYRATHLMTVAAKQIITGFYGRGPRYSYFHGCSTGGQQAMMEAQRFPDDYDGIIAGAPANNRTHVHTNAVWVYKQFHATPASYFTPDKGRPRDEERRGADGAQQDDKLMAQGDVLEGHGG